MSNDHPLDLTETDPFDLPEWLGERDVVWNPTVGLATGHLVSGDLATLDASQGMSLACDLLAVDQAYPLPVADTAFRVRTHQVWRHGQVLLAKHHGRLIIAAPGTSFDADQTLECLSRLALAVGASPDRFSALLRIGSRNRHGTGRGD